MKKRYLALILTLAIGLAAVGCSKKGSDDAGAAETAATAAEAAVEETAEAAGTAEEAVEEARRRQRLRLRKRKLRRKRAVKKRPPLPARRLRSPVPIIIRSSSPRPGKAVMMSLRPMTEIFSSAE